MGKKHAAESKTAPSLGSELANNAAKPVEGAPAAAQPKRERVTKPKITLKKGDQEIKFTTYAMSTRRDSAFKVKIDGVEVEVKQTSGKPRKGNEGESATYSYLTLPDGRSGYVTSKIEANDELSLAP